MKALPMVSGGPVLLRIGLAAALLAVSFGCSRKLLDYLPRPPSNQPTEQRWVIGAIVRDCANLANFAAAPEHWSDLPASAVDVREKWGLAAGERYAVSIQLPGDGGPVVSDLKITGTVWSPELYGPILRALNSRLKLSTLAGGDPAEGLADADLAQGAVQCGYRRDRSREPADFRLVTGAFA